MAFDPGPAVSVMGACWRIILPAGLPPQPSPFGAAERAGRHSWEGLQTCLCYIQKALSSPLDWLSL